MTSARFMPSMLLYAGLLLLLPQGLLLCVFRGFLFFCVLFVCGTAGWGLTEWKGGLAASACDVQHRNLPERGLLCVVHLAACPFTKP